MATIILYIVVGIGCFALMGLALVVHAVRTAKPYPFKDEDM